MTATTAEPVASDIATATLRVLALVRGHQATTAEIIGTSHNTMRQILWRLRQRGLIVTRRHGEHALTQAGWTALAYDDRRSDP